MRRQLISPFRKVTDLQVNEINACIQSITGKIGSDKTNNKINIFQSQIDSNVYLADTENWNPEENNIDIEIKVSVETEGLRHLFINNNSLLGEDDILGICLRWTFLNKSIRGTTELSHDITLSKKQLDECKDASLELTSLLSFLKGEYGGTLILNISLYLKDKKSPNKIGIASVPGTNLGLIYGPIEVEFEGMGSSFPIIYYSEPNNNYTLWRIKFPEENMYEIPFSEEYIALEINKNHNDFNRIDSNSPNYDPAFFKEIIASGLELIITSLMDWFENDEGLDEERTDESIEMSVARIFLFYISSIFGDSSFQKNNYTYSEIHERVRFYVNEKFKNMQEN